MEELIKETMESYDIYIDKLEPGIETIINLVHNEEYYEAKQSLVNLLEGLFWLVEINHKLNSLNHSCSLDINEINRLTDEILKALEQNDLNLCAEILQYELKDFVCSLRKYSEN